MHLSDLTHPNQLHGLSINQIQQLAFQIREKHLQTVAATGGHLLHIVYTLVSFKLMVVFNY